MMKAMNEKTDSVNFQAFDVTLILNGDQVAVILHEQ